MNDTIKSVMKIVVLGGGISTERTVSLVSGTSICRALRSLGYKAIFVDMFFGLEQYSGSLESIFDAPDGLCSEVVISTEAPDLEAVKAGRKSSLNGRLGKDVLTVCQMADFVYLGLHGADGEDGRIQAALDLLGVPYSGSGPLGSAMAMDKAVAKRIMESAGVRTPVWREIEFADEDIAALTKDLPLPCVIKTVNGGSSIGVYMPDTRAELEAALHEVLRYSSRAVVEQKIIGKELTLPILDGRCLDAIEIVPPESGSFDYVAKYQSGSAGAREICPARITEDEYKQLCKAALALHKALGLEVYSRTDFILDADGRAWCLEVNTLPGMTPASLFPKAARNIGLDYPQLCEKIMELSLEK